MAKARKNLLIGFNFPLKGWDTGWARQQQKPLTTPDAMNVLPFDLDRRNRGAKRPGFSVLTGGAIGSIHLTYRQAQKCSGNMYSGLYVPTTDISSYPYTFSYLGTCYYVAETATSTAPPGPILSTGSRTDYDDCTACAAAVSPPPPPAATYRQVRRCTDSSLAPFWLATAGVVYPLYFLRAADDNCYKTLDTDPTTTTPGTLVGTKTDKADCAACAADRGGGGADYYQAKLCSSNALVDCWIAEDDLGPLTPRFNNLPIYFFRYDHLDEPVYILASESTESTHPGRVYDRSTETIPASSCTRQGGCYDALPATATITFTGVNMNPACTGTSDGSESWKTSGYLNGTWTLNRISNTASRAVYTGYPTVGDIRLKCYYCTTPGGVNLTCATGADIPGVCYGPATVERTGWIIRLELDTALGSITGWQVTVDENNAGQGPRAFRGTIDVASCRGSKTIDNEITSRSLGNRTTTAENDSIASDGTAVVTLGF